MRGIRIKFYGMLFALLSIGILAHSQTDRATITGTVSDQAGAVLLGATVTVTNADTKVVVKTPTNEDGVYNIPSLPIGIYTLEVSHEGFKTYTRTGISPVAGQVITANVRMAVGTASETVTVTGTPPLEVQDATEAMTMETKAIEELPLDALNGRNAINLLFSTAPAVTLTQPLYAIGTQAFFSIAGGEEFSNSISIDGTNATSGNQGMAVTPGQDSLQEMQLQTNVTDAELSQSGGGSIVYVLKSGTNKFHGTAFEFLQNEDLNANLWTDNYFLSQCASGDTACRSANSRAKDRFNDYGGSAGGPIWKNHSFIFGDYEYYNATDYRKNPTGQTIPLPQMVTASNGSYDLSPLMTMGANQGNIPNPNGSGAWINPCTGNPYQYGQVFDPSTVQTVGGVTCATPFPDNQIPTGRVSAASQKIAASLATYKPTVNRLIGGNYPTYTAGQTQFYKRTFDIKLDHNFSDHHHFSGSYDWQTGAQVYPGGLESGPLGGLFEFLDGVDEMARVIDNYTVSPTLSNTFSVSWNHQSNQQGPYGFANPTDYGLPPTQKGFPAVNFNGTNNGIGGYTGYGQGWDLYFFYNTYNYADTVMWQKGRHSVKFGWQWTANQLNASSDHNVNTTYTFNSTTGTPPDPGLAQLVGSPFSSFLLGDVWNGSIAPKNSENPRQKTMGLFVQDDFKVNPKLTLNLGLRWDLTLPGHMPNGSWENFDINSTNPNWAPYKGAWAFANSGTSFESNVPLYQFGPHLGAAYSITKKLVARASYSLNYVPLSAFTSGGADNGYFGSQNPLNAASAVAQTTVPTGYAFNWDNGFPVQPTTPPQNISSTSFGDASELIYINPNVLKLGRSNTLFAGTQYELAKNVVLDTRYTGNFGRGLHDYAAGTDVSWPNWNVYNALLQSGQIDSTVGSPADAANISSIAGTTVPYPFANFSAPAYAAIAPYPQLAQYGYRAEIIGDSAYNSSSDYNAFIAEVKIRNTHGLYVDWSYVISKFTSNGAYLAGGPPSNFSNQWTSNRQSPNDTSWWPVSTDQRQLAKGYLTYDLPFGLHRNWLNQSSTLNYLVGGWTLGYYGAYGSGTPMGSILSQYQLPYYHAGQQRAFFANGANSSNMKNHFRGHFNPGNPIDPGNSDFDPSAFASGTNTSPFGDSPMLFNHWRWNTTPAQENISIVKHFGFLKDGRIQAQVRGEFYNAFNRHYFDPPNLGLSTGAGSTFGYVTGLAGNQRVGQLAFRADW